MQEQISFELSIKNFVILAFAAGLVSGVVIGGTGALAFQDPAQNTGSQTPTTTGKQPSTDNTVSPDQTAGDQNTVSVADLELSNEPVLGNKNAKVTLVYWGDFNCMFCYKFAHESFPRIRKNFVQSGEVRVVYKNLITMGEDSYALAKASQAAWNMVGEENPDLYWKWHEQLSDDQKERKSNSKSVKEDILSTTRKIDGIDASKLEEEMASMSREEIKADIREARQRGITGTPGFVLFETGSEQGTRIVGAQPYSNFESKIKELL